MANETATTNDSISLLSPVGLTKDLTSGVVVFLVALPLCLGIALASGAPLFSGILAGIVGGLVVGSLSGSHTSVSGPAAGLTAIVATQIAQLGSFEAFLLAVVVGGVVQIGLGVIKAGALSAFFPSSVIKGLLAAIGIILILKQAPHLLGHDSDPEGDLAFVQADDHNTFSELGDILRGEIHVGAATIGILSIALLVIWSRNRRLKNSVIPAPLVVVSLGVLLQMVFQEFGDRWAIGAGHLVQLPVPKSAGDLLTFLKLPDFSQWANPAIYVAGVTIAVVASLETLLNLEAVDKLDSENRVSPPSRELLAQGAGNVVAGMIGGLPITSVIVRGSVNVAAGARTKRSAIFHAILLLVSVVFFAAYLKMIPLAALAAILLHTGFKLASPKLFRQMWAEGRYQFLPFVITVLAIVFSDLLIGIVIGLTVSVLFILNSNLRRPIRRIVETHVDGDIVHIELAHQVSFLNRAALFQLFHDTPRGARLLIDATDTDYIDPDILSLIREFKNDISPTRGVTVSLRGFHESYEMHEDIQFADFSTREMQDRLDADQVMKILREGNRRFRTDHRLTRDLGRQVDATASGQNPLAVILSCIDSRVPAELVFDLGIGDIFSVRVAGNVIGTKSLGSVEYGVAVAGVKLVVVMGHTRCGAVTSSVKVLSDNHHVEEATGCAHLHAIVDEIEHSVEREGREHINAMDPDETEHLVDEVARRNVLRTVGEITRRSQAIRNLMDDGSVKVVGAMYDVRTGEVIFLDSATNLDQPSAAHVSE